MQQKLFCFGLGYSAQHLIHYLREKDEGWHFSGTCRTMPEIPFNDIDYHIFNGQSPMDNLSDILADVSHILISIAPNKDMGDPVLCHHQIELSQLTNLKWVGYLSTTGIYGNRNGDWVNDDTPPHPTSPKGHQRWEAEQGWLDLADRYGLPVSLFRLGSIYGPDRGQLANLLVGKMQKLVKQGQYFSRIHVEDIARILSASMTRPHPGQSYNVVDNMPASTPDVLDFICDKLDRPPLPPINYEDADLSPMMKVFYSENKRVYNDRIRTELGVTLKYPTYKEGFSSLVRNLPKKG